MRYPKTAFKTPPLRGHWVCDVAGFGVLPVLHSTEMNLDSTTGKAHVKTVGWSPLGDKNAHKKVARDFVTAWENCGGYVLVQKDASDIDYSRDGYVGVFQASNLILDESGYRCDLDRRMTSG